GVDVGAGDALGAALAIGVAVAVAIGVDVGCDVGCGVGVATGAGVAVAAGGGADGADRYAGGWSEPQAHSSNAAAGSTPTRQRSPQSFISPVSMPRCPRGKRPWQAAPLAPTP